MQQELEKLLQDEKCKTLMMSKRLSRAEGQCKMGVERATQLEAALQQAQSLNWTLERTVQQLKEQNEKMQADFDAELNKLTELIKENTVSLEEIADSRKKLQMEKEDLEKHLNKLSTHYNESMENMKHEINANVAKLIETEKRCNEENEERKKLEQKVESLCAQLMESELRCEETNKQLQEMKTELDKINIMKTELENTQRELELTKIENEQYKTSLLKQNEAIQDLEHNFKEALNLETIMKADLNNKNEYIEALERKQSLLEHQLGESDGKMEAYDKQLSSLKNHMNTLQQDFGEFKNLEQLHDMINEQRNKLLEVTKQNEELTEALEKKDRDIQEHLERMMEQNHLLEQRKDVIALLTEKEAEQINIIKLLRNNLEIRAHADNELNQELVKKNAENNSLLNYVEKYKKQISQLEKIILMMEDQSQNDKIQKIKDQKTINYLEAKLYDYLGSGQNENFKPSSDNLDNLIKILEKELINPSYPPYNSNNEECNTVARKRTVGDGCNARQKLNNRDTNDAINDNPPFKLNHETMPTKIVLGNFVKKTYIPVKEDQYKINDIDRKRSDTNVIMAKWSPVRDTDTKLVGREHVKNILTVNETTPQKEKHQTRNIEFPISKEISNDKMFKFARHRL